MIEEEIITKRVVLSTEELFLKYKKIYESNGYAILSEFQETLDRYVFVATKYWNINEQVILMYRVLCVHNYGWDYLITTGSEYQVVERIIKMWQVY